MTAPGFIHRLIVANPAGTDVDAATGKATTIYAAGFVVTGRFAMANAREVELAGQQGIQMDGVALAPLGTDVRQGTRVTVGPEVVGLAGDYLVVNIRPNPLHLRCICSKITPET